MEPCVVGDWILIRTLGEGTYGRVSRARKRNRLDTADVAIKICKDVHGEEAEDGLPSTFLREVATLSALPRHASVVTMIETVLTDAPHWAIVMELATTTLTEHVRDGAIIDATEVKCLSRQLFAALAHLQQHAVLHRDVKPDNLLIDSPGGLETRLKLADFGLARFTAPGRCMTLEVVTLWYRAPEILLGQRCYDYKIDIFAAGVTMAFMLDGKHLFTAKTEWGMLVEIFATMGTPQSQSTLRCCPYWAADTFPNFCGRRHALSMRWARQTTLPVLRLLSPDPIARPTAEHMVALCSV